MTKSTSFDQPLLLHFSKFLEKRTGLHFPHSRWSDLERGLNAAANELHFSSPAALMQEMISGKATDDQLQVLAQSLTVGETYFFRDHLVFNVLEREVLPGLVASRQGSDQRLRLWTAACCTGEEAYSLAISVRNVLPKLSDWNITILATDINTSFLQKAVRGVYRRWSFRDERRGFRERYFKTVGHGRWELDAAVREMVTFDYLNLAEASFPSVLNKTNAMDVIFCRNVLMYFSQEQRERVLAKLAHCLVPGGWLFLAPTEIAVANFADLKMVKHGGITLYRKQSKGHSGNGIIKPAANAEAWQSTAPGKVDLLAEEEMHTENYDLHQYKSKLKEEVLEDTPAKEIEQTENLVVQAKSLANDGRLKEALACCDGIVVAAKMDPKAHYLRAMVLQECGEYGEAVSALKRALYLDHKFVLGHFALGNLFRGMGRSGEAEKSFQNALVLAQALAYEDQLPEGDGLTAGRLIEIIKAVRFAV